jgi:methanethiol S-methyltransferase
VTVTVFVLSHGANITATILPCSLGIFYFYVVVNQHIFLALGWIVFCVAHSLLAGIRTKQWMAKTSGSFFKYYRLYYTLFAFASFTAIIIYQLAIFSPFVFSPNAVSYFIGIIAGIGGLVVMGMCIKKYFSKLSGLKTFFIDEFTSGNELIITGIHRYVRHPLYAGTFLFIWGLFIFLPYTSLLISNFIITLYTLIGIRFEEKKLVKEFGTPYEEYKKRVPKIIPSFKPSPAS